MKAPQDERGPAPRLKEAIEVRRLLPTLALSTSAIAVKPATTVADDAVIAIDASDFRFHPIRSRCTVGTLTTVRLES
jgi:hypothetical protein